MALQLAIELGIRMVTPFRPEQPAPTVPVPALAVVALIGVMGWVIARSRDRPAAAAAALAAVLLSSLAARFAIVAWDIEPGFDVHLIQQAAGEALLAGQNPYLTHVYAPGYPYWPMSAILAAGGLVFGDARWGLLLGDAVTIAGFVAVARNVGAMGSVGALAAAVLLWNPSGLYMTWQSLPESFVIGMASIGLALLTRRQPRSVLAGVAFGIAIATKQLALGLMPFLPLSRDRGRWIAFGAAALASGGLVLVFLLMNPGAFLGGSVSSHLVEPSRDYAVNLLDPLPGVVPRLNVPIVLTGVISAGIGLAVRLRWPDAIDGWLASSAALLMIAFALIGISFVNYYQIPLALLLLLTMVPDGWTTHRRTSLAAE
jgi:hypothetical protein